MPTGNPSQTALSQVPILRGLKANELEDLLKTAKERKYAKDASILKEGEAGVGLFMILEGEVHVKRAGKLLATFGPGQFFGEMTLLDQQARSADVVASQPTRCLVLSSWEFWGYAADKANLLRGMLVEMARRLRDANNALSN